MRLRLWPASLIGRLGLVLFVAVLLAVLASAIVSEQAETTAGGETQAWRVADQLQAASRVMLVSPPERRGEVAAALSVLDLSLEWRAAGAAARIVGGTGRTSQRLWAEMVTHEPALAVQDLRLRVASEPSDRSFEGDLRLPDGSQLYFRVQDLRLPVPAIYARLGVIAALSACVFLTALVVLRSLAGPLERLVQAADAIGHGPSAPAPQEGPREVRRLAQAFNAMQARITQLIASRTEALAAVSHDLRTPISRLRLRAGFLPDEADRGAIQADLDEMSAMVSDLLAYLGGDADPEKPRRANLAAIVMTLTDAAADAGQPVTYQGPARATVVVRPLGIKRALANLINNAVAYGKAARVYLAVGDGAVVITIDDDGPGIPSAQWESVFEPFHRLEQSRNRDTGGTGLGLTIARQAISREGGTIAFENRAGGGLRVTVTLPR